MALNYWKESLSSSFETNGIHATGEQLEAIAKDIQVSHECYGLAFGSPDNPLASELKSVRAELEKERNKETCPRCNGRGRLISHGPYHSTDSECWKCHGKGKI